MPVLRSSIPPEYELQHRDWVPPIYLWVTILLQTRSVMIWSEARILRKLRSKLHCTPAAIVREEVSAELRASGVPVTPENIFGRLYVSMAKGRQSTINRLLPSINVLSLLLLDLLSFSNITTGVWTSDAHLAFRLMLASGSLAVLGARSLSVCEMMGAVLCCGLYVASLVTVGSLNKPVSLREPLLIARGVLLGIDLFFLMAAAYHLSTGKDEHISSIARRIDTGNFPDRATDSQSERFKKMLLWVKNVRMKDTVCNIWRYQGSSHGKLPHKLSSRWWYWRPRTFETFELFLTIFVLSTNGLSFNNVKDSAYPIFITLEIAEVVNIFMLLVNDTQVEPQLFLEILDVAVGDCAEDMEDAVCKS